MAHFEQMEAVLEYAYFHLTNEPITRTKNETITDGLTLLCEPAQPNDAATEAHVDSAIGAAGNTAVAGARENTSVTGLLKHMCSLCHL
jgi:hypothetical protein